MSKSQPLLSWLLAALLSLAPVLSAQAAFTGTDNLVRDSAAVDTDALSRQLQSDAVRTQLEALGVSPAALEARVARMTEQERAALSRSIGEWQAGGDALGLVAAIFLVFVITDAIGITDVFPFVRPVR